MLSPELLKVIRTSQENEITEHLIYRTLAGRLKDKRQAAILEGIARDEQAHYEIWKSLTGVDVAPAAGKVAFFIVISRVFGLTFGLKLLEKGEDMAQAAYGRIRQVAPQVEKIIADEGRHENELIDLVDEDRLKYASSVVLGLNDALVELTGALVGFTLALQNTRLVALVGLITGIAASLSMAASEYLSTKQEDTQKDPLKASLITGGAYVLTVTLLILPYLLLDNLSVCLGLVLITAVTIIFIFTYYISVAKGLNFKKRFLEMAGISLGVAAINFLIGLVIRNVFKIDV
ncbi:MAG TPA: VIT1/CCC1 transporter family protein [Candidatus Omnitrophota bacterium]|nr:VIT1/CCC1 transporter family protein [Candidatus Omnitrophota bacterium]